MTAAWSPFPEPTPNDKIAAAIASGSDRNADLDEVHPGQYVDGKGIEQMRAGRSNAQAPSTVMPFSNVKKIGK